MPTTHEPVAPPVAARERAIDSVLVAGAGRVGALVATLLQGAGYHVTTADADATHEGVVAADLSDAGVVEELLGGCDAVVSCLPYDLNAAVARAAHATGTHYFDLTEDVATTATVRELSASASAAMVPQCGLAPGIICIVGAELLGRLDEPRSLELRVGALPRHPSSALGYAFNWSPAGVVNEYLNDCEVVRDGQLKLVPALGELETVVIDGVRLEAFTTSGGAGTLCESYAGRIEQLDYKTLRYPGHCDLMRFFLGDLRLGRRRAEAERILSDACPAVAEDVVYLYAAAVGMRGGRLVREQFVRTYLPRELQGRTHRAISWTTAASACAMLELVASGRLPGRGMVRQEDVRLPDFLATEYGALFA